MEGGQLLTVYLIPGMAFYWLPTTARSLSPTRLTMCSRIFLLSASLALFAPPVARAQDPAGVRDTAGSLAKPGSGTWGAELGIGSGQSATLLRFGSRTSALLLGADVFWLDILEETPMPGGGATNERRYTVANVTGRVGFRRYSGTALPVRPFTSFGLLGGYSRDFGGPGWTAGAFGELGVSYFFSPHVSLGASGGLQVIYTRLRQEFSFGESATRRQVGVRGSAVQLLGAVYF
jgi:hypothetical protein